MSCSTSIRTEAKIENIEYTVEVKTSLTLDFSKGESTRTHLREDIRWYV